MTAHQPPEDGNVDPTARAAEDAGATEAPAAGGPVAEQGGAPVAEQGGAPAPTGAEAPEPEQDELTVTKMALAERTADLQRLQAEYVNYKRRVERDRELVRENSTYAALSPIVEVLDTIDRAREHAPLQDGFKVVAEQLERIVAQQGLTKFGVPGDPFDPSLHEALSHIGEDPSVSVTTCKVVAKAGYRIGDRVVRAAQVLVVDPAADGSAQEEPTQAE